MDVRFLISSLHLWLSEASPDQKTISYQHHSLRYTREHTHVCIFHPPSSKFYRFPHHRCRVGFSLRKKGEKSAPLYGVGTRWAHFSFRFIGNDPRRGSRGAVRSVKVRLGTRTKRRRKTHHWHFEACTSLGSTGYWRFTARGKSLKYDEKNGKIAFFTDYCKNKKYKKV